MISLYEPSEFSRGLAIFMLLGLFVVGLLILYPKLAKPVTNWTMWPWYSIYIVVLLCSFFLHGYCFRFDKDRRIVQVTTMWLYFFKGGSVDYRFYDIRAVRRSWGGADGFDMCILEFANGRKYSLYHYKRFETIRRLVEDKVGPSTIFEDD